MKFYKHKNLKWTTIADPDTYLGHVPGVPYCLVLLNDAWYIVAETGDYHLLPNSNFAFESAVADGTYIEVDPPESLKSLIIS